MTPRLRHLAWRGALVLLLLWALGALAVHNLGYPGVWYDETVQIWIAQGVNAFAPVGQPRGGWRDTVRMNRAANLDPGGYSLWLHVWSAGGHGLAWLRLSAYLFLPLSAVLLACWARELTGSVSAACLAPFIPFAYGLVLSFAFEIRAYSMEIAGVVASGYALHRVVRDPGHLNHLVLGLVLSVFVWSRYSFVVGAIAALGALACVRARAFGRSRSELEKLACLLVPFLNSAALVYRFMLRHHLGQLKPARATPPGAVQAAVEAPEYVRAWMLEGQSLGALPAALQENLLSPPALPITLTLIVLVLWPRARRLRSIAEWPGARTFPAVATMVFFAQLISAALSLRGSYPWSMGQKWSLYLHGASIVCVLYLASAGWCAMRRWRAAPALAAAALVLAAGLTARAATFRRVHWADVSPALVQLDAMPLRPRSVFVAVHDVPTLRYFYELGPRRGLGRYPEAFRFERLRETSRIDAKQECLEYAVSPLDLEALSRRLPGVRLSRVAGPASTSLSRIDAGSPLPAHCIRPRVTRRESRLPATVWGGRHEELLDAAGVQYSCQRLMIGAKRV